MKLPEAPAADEFSRGTSMRESQMPEDASMSTKPRSYLDVDESD